ncbi:MAG: peptidylprolyl isomerase [bacterium]|nr:peptidylprolyl isomerase [bacterium]MDE0601850.1 peptidylprolyl isomerase [bacterium]
MKSAPLPQWMRLGVLVLAVFLTAGACSSQGDLVATVNGESIYMADVEGPEDLVGGDVVDEQGEIIDRFEFLNRLHSLVITEVVVTKADEEFGIHPDREPLKTTLEETYETVKSDLIELHGDYETALQQEGMTDHLVRVFIMTQETINLVYEELAAREGELTAQEVEEVFESKREDLTEVCATHVLVDTREEAEAVLERALAGEEIGALAAELSVEPDASETMGELDCQAASAYVTEFAEAVITAEVGVPYGPVESIFGFHVLVVTERADPVLADHEDDIRSEYNEEQRSILIGEWFLRAATESDVQVEPQYGRWTTEPRPQVLLPS